MKSGSSWNSISLMLLAGATTLAFAVGTGAQVTTTTTTSSGTASKTSTVERGEVVTVQGNDLIVKMEDGTIRHFPNVPESTRITVDGKSLGIHDLKPGMKLQRTITTTTTPETVTTVSTVTGTIWNVMPPNSVTLTMDNGKNQTFKIPKGQKFNVDGQTVDAFGLKQGMKITATKVVETPETVVSQHRSVTGTMPTPPPETKAAVTTPPPPAPPADVPILVLMVEETPAPTTTAAKLPKTASELPLIGLLGLLCVAASFAVKLIRSHVSL